MECTNSEDDAQEDDTNEQDQQVCKLVLQAYAQNNVLLVITTMIVAHNHRQYYVARLRSLDVHIHTIGNGYSTL